MDIVITDPEQEYAMLKQEYKNITSDITYNNNDRVTFTLAKIGNGKSIRTDDLKTFLDNAFGNND